MVFDGTRLKARFNDRARAFCTAAAFALVSGVAMRAGVAEHLPDLHNLTPEPVLLWGMAALSALSARNYGRRFVYGFRPQPHPRIQYTNILDDPAFFKA
jgi:hypothetical protein